MIFEESGDCLCVCENHIFHALSSPSQIPSDLFGIALQPIFCYLLCFNTVPQIKELGRLHPGELAKAVNISAD